jgi:hypothetical protein
MLASASSAPAGTSPRPAARRMMGRAAEWSLARCDRSTAASSGSVRIAWMRPDIMARNSSVRWPRIASITVIRSPRRLPVSAQLGTRPAT